MRSMLPMLRAAALLFALALPTVAAAGSLAPTAASCCCPGCPGCPPA